MKKKLLTLLCLCSICGICSSCGMTYSSNVEINITHENNNGKIHSPNNVTLTESLHSFESKKYYNTQVLPSIGDINLLVIPVLIPGYEEIHLNSDEADDKQVVKKDIERAFFGKDDSKIEYESVASYFEKSSYGKLRLNGVVTDWFDLNETDLGYTNAANIDVEDTYEVVRAAVNWVKETRDDIDLTDYDNDQDGYIDGVWCIYSCPNYTNGGPNTDYGNYWAYTGWGNQVSGENNESPDVASPVYNLFGWASYDFMYDGYGTNKVDAHTYIHETGHFLGLNDYYSDGLMYSPTGRVDMMDSNIIDLNSYSKMLLGWTKPYLVTGEGKINLYSMSNENSCIVIPSDDFTSPNGEFDPFSEYILIELYTNDGLNYQDSQYALNDRPLAPITKGVRIYHIDNRKFYVDYSDPYNVSTKEYEGEIIDETHKLFLPISNNRGIDSYNSLFNIDASINLFDEIRLIEATNVDTFSTGGYQKAKSYFKEGDVFNLETYGETFFINETHLNNGKPFSYNIEIGEVK